VASDGADLGRGATQLVQNTREDSAMQTSTSKLTPFEAQSYLRALLSVAAADGISAEEMSYIERQAHLFGVSVDALMMEPTADLEALREQCSAEIRRMIVRDCVTLASIDNDYNDVERAAVRLISEQLGVTRERLEAFEAWTRDYWAVVERGESLLRDED
jgi:tellurite resistance protein